MAGHGPRNFVATSFNTNSLIDSNTIIFNSPSVFVNKKILASDFSNFFSVAAAPIGQKNSSSQTPNYLYRLNISSGSNYYLDNLKTVLFTDFQNINNITVAEDFESYLAHTLFNTNQLSDLISNLPSYDYTLNTSINNSFISTISSIDTYFNTNNGYKLDDATLFGNISDDTDSYNGTDKPNLINDIFNNGNIGDAGPGSSVAIFVDRLDGKLNTFDSSTDNFQPIKFVAGDTITFNLTLTLNSLPTNYSNYSFSNKSITNARSVTKTYTMIFALE